MLYDDEHIFNRRRSYCGIVHLTRAGCGKLPESWGVESVADITDLDKTQAKTALKAYGNLVDAIYNTTIG